MVLAQRKVLLVAADDFEDMELLYPLYRLAEEGVAVTVAGLDDHPLRGKKGYGPLAVDTTVDEVAERDFDALVIPGGYAPDKLALSALPAGRGRRRGDRGRPGRPPPAGEEGLRPAIRRHHRGPGRRARLRRAGHPWRLRAGQTAPLGGGPWPRPGVRHRAQADRVHLPRGLGADLGEGHQGPPGDQRRGHPRRHGQRGGRLG